MAERECECDHPISEHGFEGCVHTDRDPITDEYISFCECGAPYGGDSEENSHAD